jgi:hypothetical protein
MKTFKAIFISIVISYCTLVNSLFAEEKELETISELIGWFSNSIYVMAEKDGGSSEKWNALEVETLSKLNTIIAKNPSSLTLTDEKQRTPLHQASISGYVFMLSALLSHEKIRDKIDAKDAQGLTAYDHALLASRLSLFACNPEAMKNPFALIPILVTMPYYKGQNTYPMTLQVLAKHVSSTDETRAKEHWLKTCVNAKSDTLKAVKHSQNLQKDLIRLGQKSFFDSQWEDQKKSIMDLSKLLAKNNEKLELEFRQSFTEEWIKKVEKDMIIEKEWIEKLWP